MLVELKHFEPEDLKVFLNERKYLSKFFGFDKTRFEHKQYTKTCKMGYLEGFTVCLVKVLLVNSSQ